MKLVTAIAVALVLTSLSLAQDAANAPKSVRVPDAETAVKIAEAALIPVYGKKHIEAERPFNATLTGDVWTVAGTLRCPDGKGGITTDCLGGVALVRISKKTGRVLYMQHTM